MNKFWNVVNQGGRSKIDLFGFVGGSKNIDDGFNESEFLKEFRKIPSDNTIELSINSSGGSVYTALSIYSLLKTHKGKVIIRVDGAAMSAATIITSVPGAKVIMPKGSIMMIHHVSSGVWGSSEEIRKRADDVKKLEENVISIYAEKTGRTVEEIQEKIDAETYFSAQEAVDFGLADELDASSEVKNYFSGDCVMLNGLKADSSLFKKLPTGLINADAPKVSAVKKECPKMDLEKLKAEYPELVNSIRTEAMIEGARQERARIQAIEEIAVPGHEDLIQNAKFDGKTSAENLAVMLLKAEKAKKQMVLNDLKEDGQVVADATDQQGVVDPIVQKKTIEDEQMKAVIEAGKRGFRKN